MSNIHPLFSFFPSPTSYSVFETFFAKFLSLHFLFIEPLLPIFFFSQIHIGCCDSLAEKSPITVLEHRIKSRVFTQDSSSSSDQDIFIHFGFSAIHPKSLVPLKCLGSICNFCHLCWIFLFILEGSNILSLRSPLLIPPSRIIFTHHGYTSSTRQIVYGGSVSLPHEAKCLRKGSYWALYFQILAGHLEKAMATHSSTLAWTTPWTEEPGGLQSMVGCHLWGRTELDTSEATSQQQQGILLIAGSLSLPVCFSLFL